MLKSKTTGAIIQTKSVNWNPTNLEWVIDNGVIIADAEQDYEYIVDKPSISPIAFKLRFTSPERIAIYQSIDLMVKDFISLLDDCRLKEIDLNLQSTIDAVDYLISLGLVDAVRKDTILA